MTKPFGEITNNPETDQQAVTRLIEVSLAPFEWRKRGGGLSWIGSGTIHEGKFVYFGGAFDSPTFSESRTIRYRRSQPVALEEHTFAIDWEVGQDGEGRTSDLGTHYEIDLLSGELSVSQILISSHSSERVASYPHLGIQDAEPAEQWHQLRELVEGWQ
jgi:hypothetical protein